jgi:glycosyltransferase involved in cell wall biosynthesis
MLGDRKFIKLKKIKIHVLFPDSMVKPVGGLGEQFKQLYSRLKDRVEFFIMGFPEEKEIENYCGVFNMYPMINHSALNTIANQLNYFYSSVTCPYKPDIIHTMDYTTYTAGVFASKFWKVPLISSMQLSLRELGKLNINYCNNYNSFDGKSIHDMIEVSETMGLFYSDKIIHVSNEYAKKFPDFSEKSLVIPNGIDLNYWDKPHKNYQFQGKNKLKVVYIGRFATMKGIENLCKAKIPDNIDLFFVGDRRGGESWCYDLVMEKCKEENVFHIDFAYDEVKRDIMKSADAIIMPSLHEPFGIVGLEALAAKTILISSFTDGIREYLKEDVGLNCGKRVSTIEKNLHRFSKMSEEEKEIRTSRGYQVAKRYDWDFIAEEYFKLYLSTCISTTSTT